MEHDEQKIDYAVLGLLFLTTFKDRNQARTWKGQDWDVMDRLFEAGFICDPKGKAKSVALTPEGEARSRELFEAQFTKRV